MANTIVVVETSFSWSLPMVFHTKNSAIFGSSCFVVDYHLVFIFCFEKYAAYIMVLKYLTVTQQFTSNSDNLLFQNNFVAVDTGNSKDYPVKIRDDFC